MGGTCWKRFEKVKRKNVSRQKKAVRVLKTKKKIA
jgi:hypothetical protein